MEHGVRKKQIVDASRKIIAEKGMDALTVRELSKSLGLTDGALYKHFKSKHEIIEALIEDIERTLFQAIDAAAQSDGTSVQKLKNVFASHLSYAERRRGVSFAVINETINLKDRRLQSRMLRVLNAYNSKIQDLAEQGLGAGELRKGFATKFAGIAFFGMVQALVTFWALNGYEPEMMLAYVPAMFDLYANGIANKAKAGRGVKQLGGKA